ncbi:Alpha/Beta hydrolase protein [Mycena capillaripes]|nr:Alpha/Beta hydrolase protein [Mycena capillaripes]
MASKCAVKGTPVVYMSWSYHLGPFRFPTGLKALAEGALNLPLRDEILALEWIQDNIHLLNGDKSTVAQFKSQPILKVTLFGESAGAMSMGVLYLNSNLQNLVRAAIFESGDAASPSVFEASTRQSDWDNFVRAVPGCGANSSALLQAMQTAIAKSHEEFPWAPVLDGTKGLLPDLPSVLMEKTKFARVPFIAGTNLDEGTYLTTPLINSTSTIESYLIANYTTSTVSTKELKEAVEKFLQLYPDVPALGSPFNTGNATFGLSSQFKRFAAIRTV